MHLMPVTSSNPVPIIRCSTGFKDKSADRCGREKFVKLAASKFDLFDKMTLTHPECADEKHSLPDQLQSY